MTREERKLLGYFSRLDDADQEIILEILRKSIRVNRTIWSAYCFHLIKRLDEAERRETNTIDLFDGSAPLKKQFHKPERQKEPNSGGKKDKTG